MGTLSYLLFEESRAPHISLPWQQQWMGRLLCGSMLGLLSLYCLRSTDAMEFFLFGLWPFALLAWQSTTGGVPNHRTLRLCGGLLLGMVIGSLPLLTYHVLHGSLVAMIDDNVFRALDVLNWNFKTNTYWWLLTFGGLIEFGDHPTIFSFLNAVYFCILPLAATFNGIVMFFALQRKTLHIPLTVPILGMFYGLVSMLIQTPIYLYFTGILSIAGTLWLLLELQPGCKKPLIALLLLLSGVSIAFHSGEPISRTIFEHLRGSHTTLLNSRGQLHKVDLWIKEPELESYKKVAHIIEEETNPGDYLFSVPNNAEFYFMTERRNPFRFFSTDHGVLNDTEVQEVIHTLEMVRPRIITFSHNDPRNTIHSLAIMNHVREHSELLLKDKNLEVYRYSPIPSTTKKGSTKNFTNRDNPRNVQLTQSMP